MKKKSAITVKEAVQLVFDDMPNTFHAIIFVMKVRVKVGRPSLMDGTILRTLRKLRAEYAEYNYRCIDNEIAIYKKV